MGAEIWWGVLWLTGVGWASDAVTSGASTVELILPTQPPTTPSLNVLSDGHVITWNGGDSLVRTYDGATGRLLRQDRIPDGSGQKSLLLRIVEALEHVDYTVLAFQDHPTPTYPLHMLPVYDQTAVPGLPAAERWDGQNLTYLAGDRVVYWTRHDNRLAILRAATGAPVVDLTVEGGDPSTERVGGFSDGSVWAFASDAEGAGSVKVWNAETGVLLAELGGRRLSLEEVYELPDGHALLVGENRMEVWQIPSASMLWSFRARQNSGFTDGSSYHLTSDHLTYWDGLRPVRLSMDDLLRGGAVDPPRHAAVPCHIAQWTGPDRLLCWNSQTLGGTIRGFSRSTPSSPLSLDWHVSDVRPLRWAHPITWHGFPVLSDGSIGLWQSEGSQTLVPDSGSLRPPGAMQPYFDGCSTLDVNAEGAYLCASSLSGFVATASGAILAAEQNDHLEWMSARGYARETETRLNDAHLRPSKRDKAQGEHLDFRPHGASFLADGRTVVWQRHAAFLWDPTNPASVRRLPGDDFTHVLPLPDGGFVTFHNRRRVWATVWDRAATKPSSSFVVQQRSSVLDHIEGAALLDEGRYVMWSQHTVWLVDPSQRGKNRSLVVQDGLGPVLHVDRSDTGVIRVTGLYGVNRYWTDSGDLLATSVHLPSGDWAVVSPDGRFDRTDGFEGLHFVVDGQEILELDQLFDVFYEPDLLNKVLGKRPDPRAGTLGGLDEPAL